MDTKPVGPLHDEKGEPMRVFINTDGLALTPENQHDTRALEELAAVFKSNPYHLITISGDTKQPVAVLYLMIGAPECIDLMKNALDQYARGTGIRFTDGAPRDSSFN